MAKAKKFNFIYSQLVKSDADLSGIIAYHFYKKQKVEWCKAFFEKHQKDPTDQDLEQFHNTFTPEAINGLYIKAEKTMEGFANDIIAKGFDSLKGAIEKGNGKPDKFWPNVGVNLVSSFIYSFVWAVIAFIIWSLKHDAFVELVNILSNK